MKDSNNYSAVLVAFRECGIDVLSKGPVPEALVIHGPEETALYVDVGGTLLLFDESGSFLGADDGHIFIPKTYVKKAD